MGRARTTSLGDDDDDDDDISYDKVFVCLSVTSLPRIVPRLGLRGFPRLLKKILTNHCNYFFAIKMEI